jgi:hypothetical protein
MLIAKKLLDRLWEKYLLGTQHLKFNLLNARPYFRIKDVFGFLAALFILFMICFWEPWVLGDPGTQHTPYAYGSAFTLIKIKNERPRRQL